MAIVTRFGEACDFTAACFAPQWFERRKDGSTKVHFTEPKRTKQTIEIEETVAWLVKAKTDKGREICDGLWVELIGFRADNGIRELHERFEQVMGSDHFAKFAEWNKKDAPGATAFWPKVADALVA